MAVVGILGHFRYILTLSDKSINLAIVLCVLVLLRHRGLSNFCTSVLLSVLKDQSWRQIYSQSSFL